MNNAWAKAYTDYNEYCKQAFALSFTDYIAFASHHLETIRKETQLPCEPDVILMNAPFEYRPANFDGKRAVLLIHGFIASPYVMRALGKYFLEKGYLVRAILLPGHGCSPGELLNAKFDHWQQAVDYGMKGLFKEAEQVHICGFSLGGILADLASYRYHTQSLIKIAPAYGISRLSTFLPSLTHMRISRLLPFLQWSSMALENNVAAYTAFPMHGAAQVYFAIRALRQLMQDKAISCPSFIAASQEDATVKIAASLKFLEADRHTKSQMRLYSSKVSTASIDARIQVIDSSKLAPRIVDISHIAMPIAPDDIYYGHAGSYYGEDQSSYYFGELHHSNLRHRPFKRLAYNPDFYGMIGQIDHFIESL
ncbi:MAG: alpha/beta fold hydrolase [Gammaproteobacteria bacterium]|nr:alpha/beta fold hydrolase [Gammaproteobacteria bacterium]